MSRLWRRILYIAAAWFLAMVCGTVGFTLIEDYPPFDAFYMTLITLTTVGYGEIHQLSRAGRVFNSFLILVGVSTIIVAMGYMTQTIIEMEFGDILNKRRNKRMIDKLENHYIVCGYGRVGRGAAAELRRAGVAVVVVEAEADRVESAMMSGLLAVAADATRDEALRGVGIMRARGLISALATDADNLFVIISAKTLNPRLHVATRAAEEGAEEKMRRAGADAVFAPYAITGHRLAQSLLRPHVVQFLDVTTNRLGPEVGIEQVRVSEGSAFIAKSIKDLHIRNDMGLTVLAIRKAHDGRMVFNPPKEMEIQAGDFLIVMGNVGNLQAFEALLAERRPVNP